MYFFSFLSLGAKLAALLGLCSFLCYIFIEPPLIYHLWCMREFDVAAFIRVSCLVVDSSGTFDIYVYMYVGIYVCILPFISY